MDMSECIALNAPKQRVWEPFNDLDILKVYIPGCDRFHGKETRRAVLRTVWRTGFQFGDSR